MKKWTTTRIDDLAPSSLAAWRGLLERAPHYESPYFAPEYVQFVGTLLPNIEVAMMEQAGEVQVILPFERVEGKFAIPVGRMVADYQGAIYPEGFDFDVVEMLRALKLRKWKFDHLFPAEGPFEKWCWTDWTSPQIEVHGGREGFLERLYGSHKNIRRNMIKAERKLARDVGELQVNFDSRDDAQLKQLLDWKCSQYEVAGRQHPFRIDWVREFIFGAMHLDSPHFRGNLSVVSAGDIPIAMEYSLHSHQVSHVLISAYDIEYAKYSPGLVCCFQHLCACAEHGFNVVDLGKGLEDYKQRLVTRAPRLREGCVDLFSPRRIFEHSVQQSRYRFLRSRWSPPVKRFARTTASVLPSIRRLLLMR